MRRYLLLTWSPGDNPAQGFAADVLDRLETQGVWRRKFHESGLALAVPVVRPPAVRRLMHGRGVVIGDLFPRRASPTPPADWLGLAPDPKTSDALCRRLVSNYWGRFVVVHQEGSSRQPCLFRDPSGAMDCLTWRRRDLTFVANEILPDWADLLPSSAGLDWSIVGAALRDPAIIGSKMALTGVTSLAPGEIHNLETGRSDLLWSPRRFVGGVRPALEDAKAALTAETDRVIGAFASEANRILAEVSGGLDSAILATALCQCAPQKVVQRVNYHGAEPQADERAFARDVATHLGFALAEVSQPELRLGEDHLAFVGGGARPSFVGVDYHYDGDSATRAMALEADTILTGQGGDTIFFQTRTPLVVADALQAHLPAREVRALVRGVAGWTRTAELSVWRVALLARLRLGHRSLWRMAPFLSKDLSSLGWPSDQHPWLQDLDDVAPAKRLQIHALASAQLFHGYSRRREAADVIHPLLAQPLVELGLAIPSFDLTLGRRDRALAREAFSSRLPPSIIERRSKGDLTAYYGRMLARSVDVLRPFLLDGLLAEHGLADRARLERILTPEAFIWQDLTPDLVELIAIEAWVRQWSGRLRNRPPTAD